MYLRLCTAEDIPEGGARGFTLDGVGLLGVKQYGKIYLYLNRCPHMGVPLEWEEHRFLDEEAAYIRCSSHGALFVKETGECVLGPCQGAGLWQLEHRLEAGQVLVEEAELPRRRQPS